MNNIQKLNLNDAYTVSGSRNKSILSLRDAMLGRDVQNSLLLNELYSNNQLWKLGGAGSNSTTPSVVQNGIQFASIVANKHTDGVKSSTIDAISMESKSNNIKTSGQQQTL